MAANIPTTMAVFEVTVAVTGETYGERAADVVRRYLYGGFQVIGHRIENDPDRTIVTVQYTGYPGSTDHEWTVQYQRDRLASGLYGAADPVWFDRRP